MYIAWEKTCSEPEVSSKYLHVAGMVVFCTSTLESVLPLYQCSSEHYWT